MLTDGMRFRALSRDHPVLRGVPDRESERLVEVAPDVVQAQHLDLTEGASQTIGERADVGRRLGSRHPEEWLAV
ncbi:hypothetical protein [Lichenibacterium ramalinae]|uniref:hypothetical protein n=1 Tax=Lichenibacterium ramalinae TaxID=2316527 RepID=UPI00100F76E5|nr:hypothetical protein [Lichenibacterium ramalinae]